MLAADPGLLARTIGDALLQRGWRVAVAESCTAGLLGFSLTVPAGSSAWFSGGVLAYSNVVKERELSVDAGMLAAKVAVSESVAAAMALGVRSRFGTELGVGITGIAGPGGGTEEKPVGLVFIGIDGPGAVSCVRRCLFPGDRASVREQSAVAAMQLIIDSLER